MNKDSELRLYSLAYVVEDYIEDDPYLKVLPVEHISDKSGVIGLSIPGSVVTKDIDGVITNTVINKSDVITAKWINMNEPNRLTAPNIHKGETVILWRYSGDRYFWTVFYNELDLRKREKATYVYSNKDDIKDASKLKQFYYWTVDTINKFARFHTDDNDGELTTYDIEINTKDGIFVLVDGLGNDIKLTSVDGTLTITTNLNVIVNTVNAIVNAAATATINTPLFTVNSGKTNINP